MRITGRATALKAKEMKELAGQIEAHILATGLHAGGGRYTLGPQRRRYDVQWSEANGVINVTQLTPR